MSVQRFLKMTRLSLKQIQLLMYVIKEFIVLVALQEVCIPVGSVPSAAVAVFCDGGICLWSQGGVHPSMHWSRHPPVNRMTDRQV